MSDLRATISFDAEAYDSAAEAFRRLTPAGMGALGGGGGFTIQVVTRDGETFDGEAISVDVDDYTGQYKLTVGVCDLENPHNRVLDIYDEIERVVVY